MTLIPITEKTQICFVDCGKKICKCKPCKTINKVVELKTSKGEFVVDEMDITELAMCKFFNNPKMFRYGTHLQPMFLISEATEGDAKLIVTTHESESINTHLMKLHFILKSNNITGDNLYIFKKLK